MREIEFLDSEVATAFNSWVVLSGDVIGLTGTVYRALDVVVESVDRYNWLFLNRILGFEAPGTYDNAKAHKESGNQTLHVVTLLASWGVFETLVEDACLAMVRTDPSIVDSDSFKSGQKRADKLQVPQDERVEFVAEFVLAQQRGPLTPDGGGKYEDQLALVGLGGSVPRDLAETLMLIQQVRNVWAHNGGRADKKLLDRCPDFDAQIGQKVPITYEQILDWISAMNTYAHLVLCRYRVNVGLPALSCYRGEANRFKEGFDQIFPDAISPDSLQDRLRKELGVPPE